MVKAGPRNAGYERQQFVEDAIKFHTDVYSVFLCSPLNWKIHIFVIICEGNYI